MLENLFSIEEFNNNFWWLYLILAVIVALVFLSLLIIKFKKKDNKSTIDYKEIFNDLGGKTNIISHELKGTRLVLVLKDYNQINREKLTKYGVERVVVMANKYILVGKKENLEEINNNLD